MHRFLVVGCGGSGGVTVQFLMDQLKADLAQKGIYELPKGWQFVHIDVPLASDGGGTGRPDTVPAQGGRYIALGPQSANYNAVIGAVSERLINNKRFEQLATWVSHPDKVSASVADGAGQVRSVGRLLTLSRLNVMRDGLQSALDAIKDARGEMSDLARRVGGDAEAAGRTPIVLVVSSMAGGSGASMALDVCRVLSQLEGLSPANSGLFLYTPEIFDSLAPHERSNIPGNGLQMLGELVATQLGAAGPDDEELFKALDMGVMRDSRGIPFGRVFPVGARIGEDGRKFGDGKLDNIYRGLGRGLAALMLSSKAAQSWASYDLGNSTEAPQKKEDFGWGVKSNKDLQWGTFGFAQLSLGRERYVEYAAQRLAREAVLRLLEGHKQVGSEETDEVQLQRVADARMPFFAGKFPLPQGYDVDGWINSQFAAAAQGAAGGIVTRYIEPLLATGTQNAQQWVQHVMSNSAASAPAMLQAASDEAYAIAVDWYERLLLATETQVAEVIASDGLPTAGKLLSTLTGMVDTWGGAARTRGQVQVNVAAVPPDKIELASKLKGTLGAQHEIVNTFRVSFVDANRLAVQNLVARLVADILTSYKHDLLIPLQRALGNATDSLKQAKASDRRAAGLAQLRTDEFAEWPVAGNPVPARFTHAENEVLLIDANQFAALFEQHIQKQLDTAATTVKQATDEAVRRIVLDRWETPGAPREGQLIVPLSKWRPSVLATVPGRPGERVATPPGAYEVHALTKHLLQRSREWVGELGSEIHTYSSATLRDFIDDVDISDAERQQRVQELTAKFRDTLALAQPLVAINQNLVKRLHDDEAAVAYKFSAVPFGGLALSDALMDEVTKATTLVTTHNFFRAALDAESKVSRIDVFGSYHPMAPLAFSSLLRPLGVGWANASLSRDTFTTGRRSRRLPGAVAMTEEQRLAVIGGWYVARLTGRLRLPDEVHALESVQVFDGKERRDWVSFPNPLVISNIQLALNNGNNYLPAVLLSYGIALATASAQGTMDALRPYTVLREQWNSFEDALPPGNEHKLTAATTISRFLADRDYPQGTPEGRKLQPTDDPEVIRKELLQRITGIRTALATDYLRPGQEGAVGGGAYSVISRPQDIWDVPLFHEVARDSYVVLGVLEELVTKAVPQAAGQGSSPSSDVSLGG